MQYHFTIVDGKVWCNDRPLSYVTRPTHEYISHVLPDGSTKIHHTTYDDEIESFYAADYWNSVSIPDEVVKKALEAFKAGQSSYETESS